MSLVEEILGRGATALPILHALRANWSMLGKARLVLLDRVANIARLSHAQHFTKPHIQHSRLSIHFAQIGSA
ncbi:hypothetical protein [Sphingobium ummariense]|uniref:hypothetical protein n=1 Tax=Sphingobium ummariense TaxID=420994 RepID=UPI001F2F7A38|nr:hypothetical protein [Sphingobium ummariense]